MRHCPVEGSDVSNVQKYETYEAPINRLPPLADSPYRLMSIV
jgi:hypothetical protein